MTSRSAPSSRGLSMRIGIPVLHARARRRASRGRGSAPPSPATRAAAAGTVEETIDASRSSNAEPAQREQVAQRGAELVGGRRRAPSRSASARPARRRRRSPKCVCVLPTSTTSSIGRTRSSTRVRVRLASRADTLYVVPASHPCATVEHGARAQGRPLQARRLVRRRSTARPAAALRRPHRPGASTFDDGEKVLGSRAILRALERRVPSRRCSADAARATSRRPSAGATRCCSRSRAGSSVRRSPRAGVDGRYARAPSCRCPSRSRGLRRRASGASSARQRRDRAAVRADLAAPRLTSTASTADRPRRDRRRPAERRRPADRLGVRLLLTLGDLRPRIPRGGRDGGALGRVRGDAPADWLDARPRR